MLGQPGSAGAHPLSRSAALWVPKLSDLEPSWPTWANPVLSSNCPFNVPTERVWLPDKHELVPVLLMVNVRFIVATGEVDELGGRTLQGPLDGALSELEGSFGKTQVWVS